MKTSFLVTLFFTSLQSALSSKSWEVKDVLRIEIPAKIESKIELQGVLTYENLGVYYSFKLKYKKQNNILLDIFLRPKKGVTAEALSQYNGLPIKPFNGTFGRGASFEAIISDQSRSKEFRIGNKFGRRFLSEWGSGISQDILSYYFTLDKHKFYDGCIVQFQNLWPEWGALPDDYSPDLIDTLTLNVGDTAVPFTRSDGDDGIILTATLPASVISGERTVTRLTLQIDHVSSPADLGQGDDRTPRGLAFSRLTVTPK